MEFLPVWTVHRISLLVPASSIFKDFKEFLKDLESAAAILKGAKMNSKTTNEISHHPVIIERRCNATNATSPRQMHVAPAILLSSGNYLSFERGDVHLPNPIKAILIKDNQFNKAAPVQTAVKKCLKKRKTSDH